MEITVKAIANSSLSEVWKTWNDPEDIQVWNTASDEWRTTEASVDLQVGGELHWRMEAIDGSAEFDFVGTYTAIQEHKLIEYSLEDERRVRIEFEEVEGGILITETFEPESVNDLEPQEAGWQAILDYFVSYVESK